jgi:hypothetical protein
MESEMNKTLMSMSALVALAAGTPALAQQPAAKAQVLDMEAKMDAVKVTAVVQAVDLKNRIVTLTGPAGNTFSVVVSDEVKNLPQVKVGDQLVVSYFEAVVLDFQKGDGIRMATVWDDAAKAKPGAKPGVAAAGKVTLVTNIWAIDAAKGTVLVRGPYGHFTEVKLKDKALLTGVKVGDQMKISYSEAIAIRIEKP